MSAVLAFVTLLAAAPVQAHDHGNCPMGSGGHRGEVDRRHDGVTGVGHDESVHHFLLDERGGTIRLEATDAANTAARDRIRVHLQTVARAFAKGDFALPRHIHGQAPPGVEVMKSRRAEIRYEYAPTSKGGEVRIATRDAQALTAVHAFLRFQIEDHGTGDPRE